MTPLGSILIFQLSKGWSWANAEARRSTATACNKGDYLCIGVSYRRLKQMNCSVFMACWADLLEIYSSQKLTPNAVVLTQALAARIFWFIFSKHRWRWYTRLWRRALVIIDFLSPAGVRSSSCQKSSGTRERVRCSVIFQACAPFDFVKF